MIENLNILQMLGIATLILFGIGSILILIAIFIEEANNKIKFWRLIWRKFRRWLKNYLMSQK